MNRILQLFADIFEYPSGDLLALAKECRDASLASGLKTDVLDDFCRSIEGMSRQRIEELYAETFDLRPDACPYIGYHLFGEGYQRSAFMLELRRRYRGRNYAVGPELADHLSVVLRFISSCDDPEERAELIDEGLLPALEKMIGVLDGGEPVPYRAALVALCGILKGG